MDFLSLPHEAWSPFFDGMTKVIRGKLVEIEIAGLDLGDLQQTRWLPLDGITYEPKEDTLFVYAGLDADGFNHAIPHPKAISVELGEEGISQVMVADGESHQQFLRLRTPLQLAMDVTAPA